MRNRIIVVAVVVAALGPAAAAAETAFYWNRPHAELRIIQQQLPTVAPIIDARCTGVAPAKVTVRGLRLYRVFDCRALTNVGGRYPWVAVRITVTGPATFHAVVA